MERNVLLGDLCEFKYGDALRADRRIHGSVRVFGSNGMVGRHNKALTKGPTIIIGRKGSIGEVHWSEDACYPIDTTYYVDETKQPCDLKWLFYALQELHLTRLDKSAAVPGLNRDDAYQLALAFPDLGEQELAVALLDGAESLQRIRQLRQSLANSLRESAFYRFFGDPRTNPYGWDQCLIDDALDDSQYGTSRKSNSMRRGYPIVGMGNITSDGQVDLSELSFVELPEPEFKELRLKEGDVIFNRTNSTELVGKTAMWPGGTDAVLASYLVRLRLRRNFRPEFFVALLNTPYFKHIFQTRCRKAVGQSNVSPTLLREFPIYRPPTDLQAEFARFIKQHERTTMAEREGLRQAAQLRDSLRKRVFGSISNVDDPPAVARQFIEAMRA